MWKKFAFPFEPTGLGQVVNRTVRPENWHTRIEIDQSTVKISGSLLNYTEWKFSVEEFFSIKHLMKWKMEAPLMWSRMVSFPIFLKGQQRCQRILLILCGVKVNNHHAAPSEPEKNRTLLAEEWYSSAWVCGSRLDRCLLMVNLWHRCTGICPCFSSTPPCRGVHSRLTFFWLMVSLYFLYFSASVV